MRNYKNISNCWVEIDIGKLLFNKQIIERNIEDGCKKCYVIKADAYGHGSIKIAKVLEKFGVDYFGVANILEAMALRKHGINTPILILGYTNPKNANLIAKFNLTQSCFSIEYCNELLDNLDPEKKIKIHVKINSGMNRIGFSATSKKTIVDLLQMSSNDRIDIEGIFTHFYDANSQESTEKQFLVFTSLIFKLKNQGMSFKICHCCNSAATINFHHMHLDMVRIGAILYGINVTDRIKTLELMSLKARISQIFNINKGDTVSYNARYVASRQMKIATITAGYADGILRSNFDKLFITINEKKCKAIGTICMDQLMIDATGVDCEINKEAIIYGNGGMSIKDVAYANSTIEYEIMCDVGKRVKRVYIK